MICEKCGIVYEGNYCPNGCNSPAAAKKAKKPFYQKWWFWVIIVFVGIVILASSGGENESPPVSDPPAVSSTEDSNKTTSAGTDTSAESNQDTTYIPGDVFNANGLKISYLKVEKWTGYDKYSAPDDGCMYIRLLLSAENTTDTDRYISAYEFECYADGKKVDMYYIGEDALDGGTLSAGRVDEGYIYFIVPINAVEIEVEYETNFWTDKKAILKVIL